ncbi:hypothetical protein DCMF_28075 [Candidatus Formimonas warabiya]|uniref:Uncharacterized protein n=2 Tax=Formimonas warabiya TaxID=1761012 RepID=A0A3G1L0T2_FORW1|nr:hypothetical protein DCMF_28075 [Candidatus Formimonas warabiya]
MLHDIIKKVEEINYRISEISKIDYMGLKGIIILNENNESSGVILLSDRREIQFNILASGQLAAYHESNQKIVSGLRTKILDLMKLRKQRDTLFREFILQTDDPSMKDDITYSLELL